MHVAVGAWLLVGAASFALLPWYFLSDKSLLQALPDVFGAADTASGLMQVARYGRPWLAFGIVGLLSCAIAWRMPASRKQGGLLIFGAAIGLGGLLAAGFAIGAKGWSYEWKGRPGSSEHRRVYGPFPGIATVSDSCRRRVDSSTNPCMA